MTTLTHTDETSELDRVRVVYAQRRKAIPAERYARANPAQLYALHERESAMISLLRAAGITSFAGARVLDVGCGRGAMLRQLLDYGADPELLIGVDLLQENVADARRLAPHLKTICCSASQLPFPSASFKFVFQSLLFTSVLESRLRKQIAAEISRVLVPRGWLLWYDFAYNNPRNPNVRGVRRSEIRQLFPQFSMTARRAVLAPPIGRILWRLGPAIYYSVAQLGLLCTHNLCLLQKL